jgi:hypothetical protein
MSFFAFLDEMSPTLLGIVLGSLLTIVGVILTNASNTKRLRLQHEHERALESKERDASLRRETYLAAIEAISAGMVAVGRFGEINITQEELMQSYTERSPSIAKVSIVGNDDTIKAVANFNRELVGTFLRLASDRQNLNVAWERYASMGEKIKLATREQDRLLSLMDEYNALGIDDESQWKVLQGKYEAEKKKIERLAAEQDGQMSQLIPAQLSLIQKSLRETAALDQLLTPVISRMRAELELPFDEAYYNQIIAENHKKQQEYLEAFIQEQAIEMEREQVQA